MALEAVVLTARRDNCGDSSLAHDGRYGKDDSGGATLQRCPHPASKPSETALWCDWSSFGSSEAAELARAVESIAHFSRRMLENYYSAHPSQCEEGRARSAGCGFEASCSDEAP